MHIGKIGQFLEVWGFPQTQVGLCVDGPCKTAGYLQNTPGTPAMDFPLVAAGSQSALYCAHSMAVASTLAVKNNQSYDKVMTVIQDMAHSSLNVLHVSGNPSIGVSYTQPQV